MLLLAKLLFLLISPRPADAQVLHVPAILAVNKFQPHHAVVKAVGFAAPCDEKSLRRSLAGELDGDFASRRQMKPRVDPRSAVVNRNDLRPVEEFAPRTILAAQDDRNLNRESAAFPSIAHEVDRACSPPGRGVGSSGFRPRPGSNPKQHLHATGWPKKKNDDSGGVWARQRL